METEDRVKALQKLQGQEEYGTTNIPWNGASRKFKTYEIDTDVLVYNRLNGRILLQVQEHERNVAPLDPADSNYTQLIESFIWKGREKENKLTQKSLIEQGQFVPGVVSLDGVIVAGNRRASLINKINKEGQGPMKFLAAILPVNIDGDAKQVIMLEKTLQHGIEDQVGYGTLNKYLEIEQLSKQGLTDKEILSVMSSVIDSPSRLERFRATKKFMDEYLEYIEQKDQFSLVGNAEDLFTRHTDISAKDPQKGGKHAEWEYTAEDVSTLRMYYFDYARSQKGGDTYRVLGKNTKRSFFAHEEVWDKYKDLHDKAYQDVLDKIPTLEELREMSPDSQDWDLIQQHEKDFQKDFAPRLEGIFNQCNSDLLQILGKDDILNLAKDALRALKRIEIDNPGFTRTDEELVATISEARKLSADLKILLE